MSILDYLRRKKLYRVTEVKVFKNGRVLELDQVIMTPTEKWIKGTCSLEASWRFCRMIADRNGLRLDQVIGCRVKAVKDEDDS